MLTEAERRYYERYKEEEEARREQARVARRLRKERDAAQAKASEPCREAVAAVWQEYGPKFDQAWQVYSDRLAEIRRKYEEGA